MKINSREIIFKTLMEIDVNKAYSNISIERNIDENIPVLDEKFIREIVYGVIENKTYLDWVIDKFSKIKIKKISPKIKNILRMGIYQIIFMEKIPDSAAVNESVKLSKKYSHRGTHGYVNAILRNVSRKKDNLELTEFKKNSVDYLSVKYSYPKWIVKKWVKDFGYNFTRDLIISNSKRTELNIRVNTLKINRDDLIIRLKEKNLTVRKTKYANDGIVVEDPVRITDTEEYRKGYFQIQDESSMLVSQIMNAKEDSLVIDVSSAPGGKTTHTAQIMNNKGSIIARDIYEHKIRLVEKNAERLGINIIKTEVFDALNIDNNLINKVDYCLVDVPCSGLGLIRRKPDIKWNKSEKTIKNLVELQYRIIENTSKYLKSGGILVYSTCTIERMENIDLIRNFLKRNKDFTLCDFSNLLNNKKGMETSTEGYLELFPHVHGTDGFFIAKLIKL